MHTQLPQILLDHGVVGYGIMKNGSASLGQLNPGIAYYSKR